MVGLGEERGEVHDTIRAIREAGTDILTVGQYLRPSLQHLPLVRYYTPEEFAEIKAFALGQGFAHVESGPLVRSSYHAEEQVPPRLA
jgi:lipoic acid synthetase